MIILTKSIIYTFIITLFLLIQESLFLLDMNLTLNLVLIGLSLIIFFEEEVFLKIYPVIFFSLLLFSWFWFSLWIHEFIIFLLVGFIIFYLFKEFKVKNDFIDINLLFFSYFIFFFLFRYIFDFVYFDFALIARPLLYIVIIGNLLFLILFNFINQWTIKPHN
ncbi:MAG: hypothetical protein WDZ80_05980 [Candidatus Paceibacterota bacterium]